MASMLTLAVGGVVSAAHAALDVRNEAMGTPGRAQQDAMLLKPFDAGVWSELSGWTNGEAIKSEDVDGKPVLIVTWAGWYPGSDAAVRLAQSLHDRFADKGLVVVGVHESRGADKAAAAAERLKVKFRYAVDADNKFKSKLKLDQSPDFAVVDRAGNLRYLDIETSSVGEAVNEVLNETREDAAGKPGAVASAAEKARLDALKTGEIGNVLAPGQTLQVEFEMPEQEVYDKISWPYRVKGEGRLEFDKLSDKLIHEPPKLNRPEDAENYYPKLPDAKGKLVVMYFIDPKVRGSLNVLPTMNNIQDVFIRDMTVVGVAAKFGAEAFGLSSEDAAKLAERNDPLVKEIYRTRPMNHSMLANISGLALEKLSGVNLFGRSIEDAAVCLILSTDGTIRWIGHPAEEQFRVMANKLIAVDPGVKARRKAEDAAMKSGKR